MCPIVTPFPWTATRAGVLVCLLPLCFVSNAEQTSFIVTGKPRALLKSWLCSCQVFRVFELGFFSTKKKSPRSPSQVKLLNTFQRSVFPPILLVPETIASYFGNFEVKTVTLQQFRTEAPPFRLSMENRISQWDISVSPGAPATTQGKAAALWMPSD